jgi:hypothetical protein
MKLSSLWKHSGKHWVCLFGVEEVGGWKNDVTVNAYAISRVGIAKATEMIVKFP